MGEITMTMQEVLMLPNFVLFEPHNYIDYEHIKKMIVDHYIDREIAYETVDLFKLKLNHYLDMFESNYNRMLKAQLIDIDPFVTEYIVSDVAASTKTRRDDKHDSSTVRDNDTSSYKASTGSFTEGYADKTTADHKKDNVSTDIIGKLQSEATNTVGNETSDRTTDETTKTVRAESIDKTTNDTMKRTEAETKTRDRTQKETTEYTEDKTTNETVNRTKQEDNTSTDNQTGREWKENGTTEGHQLGVASDTPQAMLFNEPNHYYGTGRAHDYGVVKQDANGNDVYQHYPETEPNAIDTGSYKIGSGDTPWFNYATAANNTTGHNSYSKNGSETYSKGGTSNTSTTEDTTTEKTENTEGNKTVNLTEKETTKTDKTTDETRKITEATKEDETTDFTSNVTEHIGKDMQEAVARNLNEHAKQDSTEGETYNEQTAKNYDKNGTNASDISTNQKVNEQIDLAESRARKEKSDSSTKAVRKGRTMRSPSQLLAEYRKTLTFNADLWLLSELTPLFLELY